MIANEDEWLWVFNQTLLVYESCVEHKWKVDLVVKLSITCVSRRRRRKWKKLQYQDSSCLYLICFPLFSFKELAISSTEKRNWRGICIALLVISAVLSIIVFSIFLLSPGKLCNHLYAENLVKIFSTLFYLPN